MDAYLAFKWLHIVSSTILFGTGVGTAAQMWLAHMRGDVAAIATVTRNVVFVDWIFTGTSAVIQPLSGLMLIVLVGYDLWESWLVITYLLYVLTAFCWFRVVWLQIQIRNIAAEARDGATALPPIYYAYMRQWFWLGWPAFTSLMIVFALMIGRPALW